ncbi:hypothetical protein RSal33209_3274 [Renibacterium salmoninarum ATCC 33209]|uniref:Uncharacterized protein n=1 Tax=Renibacterium salmoninarum (strain ATCC 33209 / DSM 20767 / JCM 11484 / NBRC 15589 / NCIMB 2235) TaxID=288705 RepID=A9WUW7_RENSM|nr:hypothetical protein RSal33209_3274 [Renibacterium salmoninarum ATCC 33209]
MLYLNHRWMIQVIGVRRLGVLPEWLILGWPDWLNLHSL